jgi:hypothetical protein
LARSAPAQSVERFSHVGEREHAPWTLDPESSLMPDHLAGFTVPAQSFDVDFE